MRHAVPDMVLRATQKPHPPAVQLFLRGSESEGGEEPKWLVSFVCFILLLIMSLKSATITLFAQMLVFRWLFGSRR